jgi:hypothetical protein
MFLFPPRGGRGPMLDPGATTALRLSDRTRDRETTIDGGVAVVEQRVVKLRRADDLFQSLANCALLAVADTRFNAEIVRGASRLIARATPLLMVETEGLGQDDRIEQLKAIASIEPLRSYRLFDGDLRPGIEFGGSSVFLFVPDHLTGTLLASEPLPAAASGIGFVACDRDLPAEGLHAAETNGVDWWRWSGPARLIRALLPVGEPGVYDITLRIVAFRRPAIGEFAVRVGGVPVPARLEVGDGAAALSFQARVDRCGFRGWIDLAIRHGACERAEAPEDLRMLGLCLGGFLVRPAEIAP